MTVAQLLRSMSSSEFAEWMAFDSLEPFGETRADLRAGIIAAASVNHSMSPPRKPARPVDFMPFAKGEQREAAPILLADPVEHGKLLASTLFGRSIVKKQGEH